MMILSRPPWPLPGWREGVRHHSQHSHLTSFSNTPHPPTLCVCCGSVSLVPLSVQLLALLFGSLALHACVLDSGCGPVWGGGLRPSKPAATEAVRRVPHKQRKACLLFTLFDAYGMCYGVRGLGVHVQGVRHGVRASLLTTGFS